MLHISQGFNGADLRNVCTEAGMSAIRAERDYVIHEDFMKVNFSTHKECSCACFFPNICAQLYAGGNLLQAVRKLNEAKKLESTAHYNADFGKD